MRNGKEGRTGRRHPLLRKNANILTWRYSSASISYGPVSVCRSSHMYWTIFLAHRQPSTYPMLCFKDIGVSPKCKDTFLLELCPKLWIYTNLATANTSMVAKRKNKWQSSLVGLLLTKPGDDGGCRQVASTSTNDHRLLITFSVQFCVQHDGRLGLLHLRKLSQASANICCRPICVKNTSAHT